MATARCGAPRTAGLRWKQVLVGAVSLGLVGGLGMTAEAAAAPPGGAGEAVTVLADGRLRLAVADGRGATGTVVLGLEGGEFTDIDVTAVVDGVTVRDSFAVEEFVPTGGENFRAELRSEKAGRTVDVDTTAVTQQAFPVLFILGLLARMGIRWVVKWYGKRVIKKAVKSYLLNNINAHKWSHIMRRDHYWNRVGARSREQIADLMGRAMAEGKHGVYKNSPHGRQAEWNYRGETIIVTYGTSTGKISDGWVKR
ncbi:hypothetical protein GCM10009616_05560 [Microlunatus lacustris]